VFLSGGDDSGMQRAHERVRASFRCFWRGVAVITAIASAGPAPVRAMRVKLRDFR